MRLLLLLTDDNFLSEVLGSYLRRDGIEVVRIASMAEAYPHIGDGASGILVDLGKRSVTGDDIIAMSHKTERSNVPLLLVSAQPRKDVVEFAAVVRASDIVSKTERMTAIAARLRMWVNTPHQAAMADAGFAIPELAVST